MSTCKTCGGSGHAGIGAGCQTCHSTGEVASAAELLGVIVANAVIGPDATMQGSTDCYHVPVDDIDLAREWLTEHNEEQTWEQDQSIQPVTTS